MVDPHSYRKLHMNRSGRVLGLVAGLLAVFAASSAIGFYFVGPRFAGMRASATTPEPAGSASAAPADTGTGVHVDISERPGAGRSIATPTAVDRTPDTPSHSRSRAALGPSTGPDAAAGEAAASSASSHPTGSSDKTANASSAPQAAAPQAAAPSSASAVTRSVPEKPDTPDPTARRAPAPETSARDSNVLYRVQIGTYSDAARAQKVADDLQRSGQAASVTKTTTNGRDLYRVQAGLFRNRENADRLSQQLKDRGVDNSVLHQPDGKPQ